MDPTGRVGQHEIGPHGGGVLDGVEDHGARVGTLGAPDDRGTGSLGPQRQLVDRRCPVGVTGGEDDSPSLSHLAAPHLADRRRLAHAIHADEEPDARRSSDRQGPVGAVEPADDLFLQDPDDPIATGRSFDCGPFPHQCEERLRWHHTDVGEDQRLLEPFPGGRIDLVATTDGGQPSGEGPAGAAETVTEAHGAGILTAAAMGARGDLPARPPGNRS